jgi:hypothetical protein
MQLGISLGLIFLGVGWLYLSHKWKKEDKQRQEKVTF